MASLESITKSEVVVVQLKVEDDHMPRSDAKNKAYQVARRLDREISIRSIGKAEGANNYLVVCTSQAAEAMQTYAERRSNLKVSVITTESAPLTKTSHSDRNHISGVVEELARLQQDYAKPIHIDGAEFNIDELRSAARQGELHFGEAVDNPIVEYTRRQFARLLGASTKQNDKVNSQFKAHPLAREPRFERNLEQIMLHEEDVFTTRYVNDKHDTNFPTIEGIVQYLGSTSVSQDLVDQQAKLRTAIEAVKELGGNSQAYTAMLEETQARLDEIEKNILYEESTLAAIESSFREANTIYTEITSPDESLDVQIGILSKKDGDKYKSLIVIPVTPQDTPGVLEYLVPIAYGAALVEQGLHQESDRNGMKTPRYTPDGFVVELPLAGNPNNVREIYSQTKKSLQKIGINAEITTLSAEVY